MDKNSLIENLEKDLSEMKSVFASVQEEKQAFTSKMSIIKTEREKLKDQLMDAKIIIEQQEKDLNKYQRQLVENQNALHTTSTSNSDSKATIEHLRTELKQANADIDELKDALKSALLQKRALHETQKDEKEAQNLSTETSRTATPSSSDSSSPTPLFFAMEKQAELIAARDEISRLASLLGDANQEKAEALEEARIAFKKLDEAEAMLLRQRKMGKTENGSEKPVTTSRKQTDSAYEHMSKFENAADMNLEYLKNIMLKYLSARNQAERKALIPAISAVLCLTQEETKQAFESVNASTGIGNTLFDSISRFRG